MKQPRCLNLDWLECHCIEPFQSRGADYFRSLGWSVRERGYGTRVYKQMFTLILPDGNPFIEIRRLPSASFSEDAARFFEVGSCHLRFHNRTCYFRGAAQLMLDFIHEHGYEFRRISRIDLCLDFEKFDTGEDPQGFVQRYIKRRYSKINQGNLSVHGQDLWDGLYWNSLSWGSPKSMITTKLYNKTLELSEAKDKPYIRQAWASCGLVDDFIQMTRKNEDGTFYKPVIWRLEFSIKSTVKNWLTMTHDELGNKCYRSLRNTLDIYTDDNKTLELFKSLVSHYFHFKHYVKDQRKDRCKDKELFRFTTSETFYKVDKVATSQTPDKTLLTLQNRLKAYRASHFDKDTNSAIDVILSAIRKELIRNSETQPYNESEVQLIRRLIAYRTSGNVNNPLTDDIHFIQQLLSLPDKIF